MLNRRTFLAATSATFAFSFSEAQAANEAQLTAYITLKKDGSAVIQAPAAEMGQGINTTIPLIIAEELDINWKNVKIKFADTHPDFNHPVFRTQFTVASLSTRGYWLAARTAGAQARRMLINEAAKLLNEAASDLTAENSVVFSTKTKSKITYGEIVDKATFPKELPTIKPEELKPLDKYVYLGKDVAKYDAPNKTNGKTKYSIDVVLPKMLYASVVHPPALGMAVQGVNIADVKKIKGIERVLTLDSGVAVVGKTFAAVLAGRKALKIEWGKSVGSDFNSESFKVKSLAAVRDAAPGVNVKAIGELEKAFPAGAKVLTGEYVTDYTYHAQMEPLNAVVEIKNGQMDIYAGTQWQSFVVAEAAKIAGLPPEKVKLHFHPMGGGYGRRAHSDFVLDAVKIAMKLDVPVKMINTREEDVKAGYFRPQTTHRVETALKPDGTIAGMKHRLSSDTVVPLLYGKARMEAQKNIDHIVTLGLDASLYGVEVHHVQHILQENGVRTAAFRGIGYGHNHFPIETMVDLAAKEAGKNPLDYRLSMIKDARAKAVLEKVAAMSAFKTPVAGRSKGLAMGKLGLAALGESIAATVVEISVSNSGAIKVHNIWCAVDCGLALQPDNIKAQVEGCMVWGVSTALKERVSIKNGSVEQSNFTDYDVLRASETPLVQVEILKSGTTPLPVGELGLSTVPPAIANAFVALTGKNLRAMPFLPERVKAA